MARVQHEKPAGGASLKEAQSAEPSEDESSRVPRDRGLIYVFLFIALLVIIVAGTVGYVRWHRTQVTTANSYHGFDFARITEGSISYWVTEVQVGKQPFAIPFYNHPRDLESIPLESGLTERFTMLTQRPERVYLTFDEDADASVVLAGVEISRILGERYGILNLSTKGALKSTSDNRSEAPIVTCRDATKAIAVLSFDSGPRNVVYTDAQNPACIHLEYADANSSLRVADRFAYGLLRIMPG